MKTKKMELKLKLNKITICKLDNLELGHALAGQCPPPNTNETENPEGDCTSDCNPAEGISTKPC